MLRFGSRSGYGSHVKPLRGARGGPRDQRGDVIFSAVSPDAFLRLSLTSGARAAPCFLLRVSPNYPQQSITRVKA